MNTPKKILFLTTHNLATNPRLVKEIELALSERYYVSVFCFEFDNWSKPINEVIKERLLPQIAYRGIPGNRHPLLLWLLSSLIHSSAKGLLKFFPGNIWLLGMRSNKRSWLLVNELKKIKEPIDLVVAHNPGAFYPAMHFAQKNRISFGIDLEDYHPGETSDEKTAMQCKTLQNTILSKAQYVSAASPLILEYSQKDCDKELKNPVVILNYFASNEFTKPVAKENGKLKLVWFSQQISSNRGLEQILPLIKDNPTLELHLFGNCREDFKNDWLTFRENVFIHPSLPQIELHKKLAEFDIGLAIEPGKDLNNELAVSNKMLAYFQAGLYVLASDTKAQKQFMASHPEHGRISALGQDEFNIAMNELIQKKELVRAGAEKRFEMAKKYCWEEEGKELVKVWLTGRGAPRRPER